MNTEVPATRYVGGCLLAFPRGKQKGDDSSSRSVRPSERREPEKRDFRGGGRRTRRVRDSPTYLTRDDDSLKARISLSLFGGEVQQRRM